MRIYTRKSGYRKGNESSVPNVLAFTVIRSFFTDKKYENMRKEYFINNMNQNQINQVMKDIKWLFKEYKGLDVITIENTNGNVNKFIV